MDADSDQGIDCRACAESAQRIVITRPARPEDWEQIKARHAEIEALAGEKLDLPKLDDPAILEYAVVEEDGVILGGLYIEKSVRECHFGLNPKATAALIAWQDGILASSKAAGVRFVHVSIPKDLPVSETISKQLEANGYMPRPELLDHMYDLRPEASE